MTTSKPLNKGNIVDLMSANTGLSKRQSELSLNALLKIIEHSLVNGGAVKLVDFGHFRTSQRQARLGRNPFNGDVINIPAKRAIVFRAAISIKRAVLNNLPEAIETQPPIQTLVSPSPSVV